MTLPAKTAIVSEILEAVFSTRSPKTKRVYLVALDDFARYLGVATPGAAVEAVLGAGAGGAFLMVERYKAVLLERGLSPSSVNLRLAAIRTCVAAAAAAGIVTWTLRVAGVKSHRVRSTRPVGVDVLQRLWLILASRNDARGLRDAALFRLLYDLALRREEVAGLTVGDVDLDAGVVYVIGKGRRQRAPYTLPRATQKALRRWLDVRGDVAPSDALFISFDNCHEGHGITGTGIYHIVAGWGRLVGCDLRPHGLRHAAITVALDATHGDVRSVQRYSRHAAVSTVLVYDDMRRDVGGEIATMVASSLPVYFK